MPVCKKKCTRSQVCNTASGRCVSRKGRIGKKILGKAQKKVVQKKQAPMKKQAPKKAPASACMSCTSTQLRALKKGLKGNSRAKTKAQMCSFLGNSFSSCSSVAPVSAPASAPAASSSDCMSCSLSDLLKLKAPIPDMAEFNTQSDICDVFGSAFVSCTDAPRIYYEQSQTQAPQPQKKPQKKPIAVPRSLQRKSDLLNFINILKNKYTYDQDPAGYEAGVERALQYAARHKVGAREFAWIVDLGLLESNDEIRKLYESLPFTFEIDEIKKIKEKYISLINKRYNKEQLKSMNSNRKILELLYNMYKEVASVAHRPRESKMTFLSFLIYIDNFLYRHNHLPREKRKPLTDFIINLASERNFMGSLMYDQTPAIRGDPYVISKKIWDVELGK